MKRKNIIVGIVLIGFFLFIVLFGINQSTVNRKINTAKEEVTDTVRVDLKKYLSEISSDNTGTIEQMENQTVKPVTYLSTEQMDSLVDEITALSEERILSQVVSQNSLTEQQLMEVEKVIAEKVAEKTTGTGVTASERDAIVKQISTIVESDVLKTVGKSFDECDENLDVLSARIDTNLNELKQTLDSQTKKITDMESKLSDLTSRMESMTNGNSTDKTETASQIKRLQEEINRMAVSYSALQNGTISISNIVNNLLTEPSVKNGVVSAEAGHLLKMDVTELQISLEELKESASVNLSAIENSVLAVNQKVQVIEKDITDNTSAINDLESENDILNQNLSDTSDALVALEKATDVNEATSAVSKAIDAAKVSANSTATEALEKAKEEIESAYASGDDDAIKKANENAKRLIDELNGDLQGKISSNESSISDLNTTATNMQGNINSNTSAITELQNNKVSKDELNNGAGTTYRFSGDGTNTTLTVTIP